MKKMEEKKTNPESVDAGSSADDLIKGGPSLNDNLGGGEPKEINFDDYVDKKQYEELERKLGEQGNELGKARDFMEEIQPLMEKLEGRPEIVEAIIDDKLTPELAKSILEGKVSIGDATKIAKANEEVKKDLGEKKYAKATPDDISKLIAEKVDEEVSKKTKSLEKIISDRDSNRDFEADANEFIKNTVDFEEYAEGINKFFKDNPRQYDIKIAYRVVKGEALEKMLATDKEIKAAEDAKELALNAGGSPARSNAVIKDKDIIDELIGSNVNPNVL